MYGSSPIRKCVVAVSLVALFVLIGISQKRAAIDVKMTSTKLPGHNEIHQEPAKVKTKTEITAADKWKGVQPVQKRKKWVFYNGTKDPWNDHPFDARSDKLELFEWSYKRRYFSNMKVPLDQRICFVHVGKTAGSTMGCMLGFQTPTCRNTVSIPAGVLPSVTTNIFHNKFNDCFDDMSHYLVAVRNPLHRIQSWFTYERMRDNENHNPYRKPLFRQCPYKTLNDMAEMGLAANGTASDVCKDRAHYAIRGIKRYARHNFYNYAFYRHHIPPDAKILVVRTEEMLKDWVSSEAALGSRVSLKPELFAPKNPSKKKDGDNYLSPLSQKLLCEGLCYDIQSYKSILDEALNLSEDDVDEALRDLEESCPVEAKSSSCY